MSDQEPEKKLINFIAVTVENMSDQMATKSDLALFESKLTAKLEAETTAIRGDIEQVHLRLDSIDRTLRARLDQIETENEPTAQRALSVGQRQAGDVTPAWADASRKR